MVLPVYAGPLPASHLEASADLGAGRGRRFSVVLPAVKASIVAEKFRLMAERSF